MSTETVSAGNGLRDMLKQYISTTEYRRGCAVGINNWTGLSLTNPQVHVVHGNMGIKELPQEVPTGMAVPLIFEKTGWVMVGSAGVVTYDIGATGQRVAVMWMVPWHHHIWDKWFNVRIVPCGSTNHRLYHRMYHEERAQRATEGKMTREEKGFLLDAEMTNDDIATLTVDLHKAK
ncbi:hypothetical protein Pelo_5903 [Pelomyxa schiedti]|nr:hypothetical protein Pelo_5903 [Pelomyxa schiedti]